ncbi:MAG: phosphatase PAP2 family protein [Gammaproteobacteria bacterium]|nr:phosphatase PAP2 family protein [Gammaproteobacteria bacterium]
MSILTAVSLERVVERDLDLCVWFNRACQYQNIKRLFALISWLGDGKFWYALMLVLPFVYGNTGWNTSLQMIIVGIGGLAVYRLIKARTHRLRPFMVHQSINLGASPLDQYSFPSGHTLHAVSFTIIAVNCFPALGWMLIPITTLVALSRVILGLHYPSDVAMGALIGASLAIISLYI